MHSFLWISKKFVALLILSTFILGSLPLDAWAVGEKNKKAIQMYEKDLDRAMKAFGEDSPQVATAWHNLGVVWTHVGKPDKALPYLQKALASNMKTFGKDHLNVAHDWYSLGAAWHAKGEHNKALEYYEKALTVYKKDGRFVSLVEREMKRLKKEMDGKK